jgi:hypothetical protein
MADINDWEAFARGRWRWTRYGYEHGLPRGSGFGDLDATLELSGHRLSFECKAWDGLGPLPALPTGQIQSLRQMSRNGDRVYVLWGCASCNNPLFIKALGRQRELDYDQDWRPLDLPDRRRALHDVILDWARWAEGTATA